MAQKWQKVDVSWDATGESIRRSAGARDQASGERVAEITTGKAILGPKQAWRMTNGGIATSPKPRPHAGLLA